MPSLPSAPSQAASETTPLLRPLSPVPSIDDDVETAVPSRAHSTTGTTPRDNNSNFEDEGRGRGAADDDDDDEDAALDKTQIFFLCLARTVDPIAYFCIFPYINQMIYDTGEMDEKDVGFYSGLIESLFSLTQMCLMIFWGSVADRVGRKPVLIVSMTGISIAMAVFGLSTRVWQMIFFRCCAGLFAGTIVTLRTMMTENTTAKTQARAFSFYAFAGNVGIFLGPLIGGALSNPTTQYPINKIFGNVQFFKRFPYALPTFVSSGIAFVTLISSAVYLKETLKRKGHTDGPPKPPMSTWQVSKAPGVPIVLAIYAHVMLLAFAYTALSPVFFFTPVALGGFGFSPPQISLLIAMVGVSQAIWLLVFFPPLQRKHGTVALLRGCLVAWPFFFATAPLCNWFLRRGWTTVFWIVAPLTQIIGTGVAMAFTCVQLLLNAASPPSPDSPNSKTANLGKLNAIALSLTCGTRSISPALITSIFALGVRSQVLNGYLIWVIMCTLAAAGWVLVRFGVDDIPGEGRKGKERVENGGGQGVIDEDIGVGAEGVQPEEVRVVRKGR